jgi:hypothetical protein
MSCIIDKGRTSFSCNTNAGGLQTMYVLASFNKTLKANADIDNGVITNIGNASSIQVFQFDLEADENTFVEENEVSRSAGTSIFTSSGTLQFLKQGSDSHAIFQALSKQRCQVILEDHNGLMRLVGLEHGVDFTVGTTTGGALGDMSGYNVTFTGRELELAPFINPTLVGPSGAFEVQSAIGDLVDPGSEPTDNLQ